MHQDKRRATLSDVNTTDIPVAIRSGCRCMSSVFNADDNDVPFFSSSVWPDVALSFSSYHSESHVPGRHLNALLNAEAVSGDRIPDDVIENHRRAAMLSYSGPLPLPLNRLELTGKPITFSPHNTREGFHALYALARFRDDAWAIDTAEQSILTRTDSGYDVNLLFDYASPDVNIRSPYTHDGLGITLLKSSAVRIRLPDWVDRQAVEISANAGKYHYDNSRLILQAPPVGADIRIGFPLTESTETLSRHHVQPIRVRFHGDSVAAMDNHGAQFVFFNPF